MPRDFDILLSGFSEPERKAFQQIGRDRDFTLHKILIREEEAGSSMFVIQLGEVSVWRKAVKLARMGEGAVVGASSLIEPHPRTATVMAEDYVRASVYRREDVLKFFKVRSPRLFQRFFLNSFRAHMNLVRRCNDIILEMEGRLREELAVQDRGQR